MPDSLPDNVSLPVQDSPALNQATDHDGAAIATRLSAGLWFSYGRNCRPGIVSKTTFAAVLCGERVSTTRFLCWPGRKAWAAIGAGDLVRFHAQRSMTGDSLVVAVLGVQPIDLAHCDQADLEAWSMAEGWSSQHGLKLGRELGPALWIRHRLVWPQGVGPASPVKDDPGMANPTHPRGQLQLL